MAVQPFTIRGRVKDVDGNPVHGIEVSPIDEEALLDLELGERLTNRHGEFSLVYNPEQHPELFARRPTIRIRVFDAQRQLLQSIEEPHPVRPGTVKSIEVVLTQADLQRHLPSIQAPESSGLISQSKRSAIAIAWEALAATRGHPRPFPESLALCPLPSLAKASDIAQLAHDVIGGEPGAIRAFRRRLFSSSTSTNTMDRVDQRFELIQNQITATAYWQEIRGELKGRFEDAIAPSDAPIPRDTLVALTLATVLATGNDVRMQHRGLAVLNAQLREIDAFDAVVRAAEDFAVTGALEPFSDIWSEWSGLCGPDDGPVWPFPDPVPTPNFPPLPEPDPWPPLPGQLPTDPMVIDRWMCQSEVLMVARHLVGGGHCYRIDSVSDLHACPGEIITIEGSGFGHNPGLVRFVSHTQAGGTLEDPNSWTDTSIEVEVPDEAACGPLTLKIFDETVQVCDTFVDFDKRPCGQQVVFDGGKTSVQALRWSGTRFPGCASPNSNVNLYWHTCNADHVEIEVKDSSGTVIWADNPANSQGSTVIKIPNYQALETLTAKLEASGPCGTSASESALSVQQPYDLEIDGIEVTQGIQYYQADKHLTDASDRGPDNSVRLVMGKPAWVRVYVRSGQASWFNDGRLPDVGGTLRVERRVEGQWTLVGTLPAQNPTITGESNPGYVSERGDINSSLNFTIPANWMSGALRLTASVASPQACTGGATEKSIEVTVSLFNQLRVAAVMVGYQGPPASGSGTSTSAAPSEPDAVNELATSLLMLPVSSNPDVRTIATVNATQPLTGPVPTGGCDPAWRPIGAQVLDARTNDGNRPGWVYYGFVTPSIPMTHRNVGCANGGNPAGLIGNGWTFVHELGHIAGLDHAPCGAVGKTNPDYPLYEPYDTGNTTTNAQNATVWSDASIGEYGLNINNGDIYSPDPNASNQRKDFMGYCRPRWISLYTQDNMASSPLLNPFARVTGSVENALETVGGGAMEREPIITLVGSVGEEEHFEVTSVSRVEAVPPEMMGEPTEYVAELLHHDEILASAVVFTMPAYPCEGSDETSFGEEEETVEPFTFIAVMSDVAEGTTLRIRRGQTILWERSRPEVKPEIGDIEALVIDDGRLTLRWDYEVEPPGTSEAWIRWSARDEEDWHGLAVAVQDTEHTFKTDSISPGWVHFQVLVHDGFFTVEGTSGAVEIPITPGQAVVIHPTQDEVIPTNTPIRLWGATTEGEIEPTRTVEWTLNGEVVASELDTFISPVDPGTYLLELNIERLTAAQIEFVVENRAFESAD